jgi:signal transduction histidine kinase
MMLHRRKDITLAGRLLAIVLALLVADFAVNSVLFERESSYLINNEEMTRIAEHLVVAQRILTEQPREQRERTARNLSTERFQIAWSPGRVTAGGGSTALSDQVIAAERELAGSHVRMRAMPMSSGGGIAGTLLLRDGSALEFRGATIVPAALDTRLLLLFTLPSVLLLAIAWLLVRRTLQPLQGLVGATSRVGTDDMEKLEETGQREVRQLIRAFNRMHQRIWQLLANRTQTLLAIGHDLRTPLARLQLRIDGAAMDATTQAEMETDIAEMAGLLGSLETYLASGRESGPAERLDLACMARTHVDEVCDRGGSASYAGPDRLEIEAHPLSIRRIITNLIENALHYAGNVEVSVRKAGKEVELLVADRGPGIPESRLEEVLQPFTRLDNARERNTRGMGLGLAIVDRLVAAEGGRLTLANRSGGGLAATIMFPAA